MEAVSNQRIAYYNGEYLPEGEIRIPFRDRGFLYGDGVFDMTRTFNGQIFKIDDHIERLYRSLKALRIEIGMTPSQMVEISQEVADSDRAVILQQVTNGVAVRMAALYLVCGGVMREVPSVDIEAVEREADTNAA